MVAGCCSFASYVPPVEWYSDSIPYGVGCATLAGPREPIYFAAQAAANPMQFVGFESFAGNSGGLAVDPNCECVPGIDCVSLNGLLSRMTTYRPRVVIYSCGINDVIAGASAATIAGRISAALDLIWGFRTFANTRIVLTALLRTLDAGNDAVVQAANALLAAVCAGKSFAANIAYVPGTYGCIPNPAIGVNMHDDVHPNDAGATLYGNYLWANGLSAAVSLARGAT